MQANKAYKQSEAYCKPEIPDPKLKANHNVQKSNIG